MLRAYLDAEKRFRLNIWDKRLRIPNVTTVHDHPWSFTSWVLYGTLVNQRYIECEGPPTHMALRIATGEGGGRLGLPEAVCLADLPLESYKPGDAYSQDLTEIHEIHYTTGSVTLNGRSEPVHDHSARVFYDLESRWIDAIPRPATARELTRAIATIDVSQLV